MFQEIPIVLPVMNKKHKLVHLQKLSNTKYMNNL